MEELIEVQSTPWKSSIASWESTTWHVVISTPVISVDGANDSTVTMGAVLNKWSSKTSRTAYLTPQGNAQRAKIFPSRRTLKISSVRHLLLSRIIIVP